MWTPTQDIFGSDLEPLDRTGELLGFMFDSFQVRPDRSRVELQGGIEVVTAGDILDGRSGVFQTATSNPSSPSNEMAFGSFAMASLGAPADNAYTHRAIAE